MIVYTFKILIYSISIILFYTVCSFAQLSDATYTCNTQFIKFFNQFGSSTEADNIVIKLTRMSNLGLKEDPKNFFDQMEINQEIRINADFLDKNSYEKATSFIYICKLEFGFNSLLNMKEGAEVLFSCSNELSMMKINATKNIFYGTFGVFKDTENNDVSFYRGRCLPD